MAKVLCFTAPDNEACRVYKELSESGYFKEKITFVDIRDDGGPYFIGDYPGIGVGVLVDAETKQPVNPDNLK